MGFIIGTHSFWQKKIVYSCIDGQNFWLILMHTYSLFTLIHP